MPALADRLVQKSSSQLARKTARPGSFGSVLWWIETTAHFEALHAVRDCLTEDGQLTVVASPRSGNELPMQRELVVRLLETGFRIFELPGLDRTNPRAAALAVSTLAQQRMLRQDTPLVYRAVRQPFTMRAFRPGDETDILDMFQEVFRVARTREHWLWKYRDNPYGRHMIALCLSSTGELAAHFAAYAVEICAVYRSESFVTVQGGDTMTRKAYRRYGLGPTSLLSQSTMYFYNRFLIGRMPWAYGFNTHRIRQLGERFLGYEYLPEVPFYTNARKNLLKQRRSDAEFRVSSIRRPLIELDEFFDRVAPDYRLLLLRKARYLGWRYMDCPDRKHRLFAVWHGPRLLGWSAFAHRKGQLVWGDALFDRSTALEAARTLLHHVASTLQFDRMEAWFSPNPAWWSESLVHLGFSSTAEPDRLAPMVVRYDDTYSMEEIRENFYYTKGDSDLF